MQFLGWFFVWLLFFEGKDSQIYFDGVHDGLDELFEQCVEQCGLLLIFLEDEADSLLDFFVGKVLEGWGLDIWIGRTVLMREIKRQVFNVPDEYGFLLHKQIGILGHSLINILLFGGLILDNSFGSQFFILEVLVDLFQIQELRFYVEWSHLAQLFLIRI